jgi:hypothetical protein
VYDLDSTKGETEVCVSIDDTLNRVTVTSDSGTDTRVTVDNVTSSGQVPFEDVYQDQLHSFIDALFKGFSTIILNFGSKDDRLRCLFDSNAENPELVNLASEQIFTTVKSLSGGGVEFLVHTSIFDVRKDKVYTVSLCMID